MKKGLYLSSVMNGIELWLLPALDIKAPPWTIHNAVPDNIKLKPASESPQITCPKPDGLRMFDRPLSVFIGKHKPRREPGVAPDPEGCVRAGPD